MNFYELLYAGKNSGTLSATYYELLFAKYLNPGGGDEWAEYDGTLPAQYSANGDNLADYRIYGSAGGVGDKTGNAYETDLDAPKGYYNNHGTFIPNNSYESSKKISCNANDVLTVSAVSTMAAKCVIQIVFLNSEQDFIVIYTHNESGTGEKVHYATAPSNAKYAFVVLMSSFTNKMLVLGSTAPAEYVPFGYVVPMSVSDGTTSTITPIHIGSDPLEAIGEYTDFVDYGVQKIIRKIIKIEFTGEEYWETYQAKYYIRTLNYINSTWGTTAGFSRCSHFVPSLQIGEIGEYGLGGLTQYTWSRWNGNVVFNTGTSLADFKTYLATQKAAGTPVILWYVCEIPIEEDPPVPLPQLPTVDGTNIVDYAGQSAAAPSRFYAKYRKEGF